MSHYDDWEETHRKELNDAFPKAKIHIKDCFDSVSETSDPINKPKHYTSDASGIEPITITQHMSFCLGNVVKYCMRYKLKGGVEDLKKAQWYLAKEIERLSKVGV